MTTGRLKFTSLDDTFGLNTPDTGFFSGSARSWDGDVVSTSEYWAGQSKASADAAAVSAEKAAAIASAIQEKYFGPYPLPGPTTNPVTGGSLTEGDIYYNTTNDEMMVYNGTEWVFLGDTAGVNELLGGTNINVSPDPGIGDVTVNLDTDIAVGTVTATGSGTFATGIQASGTSSVGDITTADITSSTTNTNLFNLRAAGAVLNAESTNGTSGLRIKITGGTGSFFRVQSETDTPMELTSSGGLTVTGTGTFATGVTVTGENKNVVIDSGYLYSTFGNTTGAPLICNQTSTGPIAKFRQNSVTEEVCTIENNGSITSSGSGTFATNINITDGYIYPTIDHDTRACVVANQQGDGPLAKFRKNGTEDADNVCTIENNGSITSSGSGTFAANLTIQNGFCSINRSSSNKAFEVLQSGSGAIAEFTGQSGTVTTRLNNDGSITCGSIASSGSGTFATGLTVTGAGTFDGTITCSSLVVPSGTVQVSRNTTGSNDSPLVAIQNANGLCAQFRQGASGTGSEVCKIENDGSIVSHGTVTATNGFYSTSSDSVQPPLKGVQNNTGGTTAIVIEQHGTGAIANFYKGNTEVVTQIENDGSIASSGSGSFVGAVDSETGFTVNGSPVFMESQHDTFKSGLHTAVNAATDYQSLKDAILTALA